MRTGMSYVLTALLLAALAAVAYGASRVERGVARAQQRMATLDLQAPASAYADLLDDLNAAGPLAGLFGAARADLETRRAAVRYWQGDYASLLEDYAGGNSGAAGANLALQFIVANAATRAALGTLDPDSDDRAATLRALDGAIDVYLGVLQQSPDHRDAAYNYEYLLRLRADLASGAEIPMTPNNPHGREGEAPEDTEMEEIQIYVPVQQDVDPEIDESPTLGAGQRIRRRG